MTNSDLHIARANKADEFYTSYEDIEHEICQYDISVFKNKIVYLPCDDYRTSEFYTFFKHNIKNIRIDKVISTSYVENGKGTYAEFTKDYDETIKELSGDGDFASEECREIMQNSDIVVTNPPFSLFRKFIEQVMSYNKEFIILGNINAVTYKEVFPHIISSYIKIGPSIRSGDRKFMVPDDYPLEGTACKIINGIKYIQVKGVRWFTNMKFRDNIVTINHLKNKFSENEYLTFDTYPDAININSVKEIPYDYDRVMAVPITVMDKMRSDGTIKFIYEHNKHIDYEIVGMLNSGNGKNYDFAKPVINGKCKFKRILIKMK